MNFFNILFKYILNKYIIKIIEKIEKILIKEDLERI